MNLSHAFYRYLLNPAMRGILRSPLHRIASANIGILHFTGRKSGRALSTPLSYVRDGTHVLFLSSTNTAWWKNFRDGPAPVQVDVAGERLLGIAQLLEGDSEALRNSVRRFLVALPRDAVVYGIKLDRNKQPIESSLAKAAPRLVLVDVALD
ncbi:MAG: nitroreductase/quinone reductase family protein [Pseudomonadota bacterium]